MKSLPDHLAPATQRNITVLQRLLVHLEKSRRIVITYGSLMLTFHLFLFFCHDVNKYKVHLWIPAHTMTCREAERLADQKNL